MKTTIILDVETDQDLDTLVEYLQAVFVVNAIAFHTATVREAYNWKVDLQPVPTR